MLIISPRACKTVISMYSKEVPNSGWRMKRVHEEKFDLMMCSFFGSLIVGFLYIMSGVARENDWDLSFGVMWIYAAFLHGFRYKYRKYHTWGAEELTEWFILSMFLASGLILGMVIYGPLGMCAGSLITLSIWFILWRFHLEEYVHRFWW